MTNKLPVVGKKYRDKIHHIVFKVDNIIDGKLYYTMDGRKLIANMPILIEHWNYFEELPEDKAEIKPTIKENLTLGLSSEVREAMEGLRSLHFPACQLMTASIAIEELNKFRLTSLNLLNALDKQFNLPQENTNLGEEWGSFGAVLGNDKLESLENKESIITMKKSEFESLMAGAEKVDKVDTDIKKQTVDEFLSETEKEKSIWKPVSALKPNELVPVGFVRKNKKYQATFSFTHQTVEEWEGIIKEFCSLNYFLNDYEKLKERVKKLEEK